MALRYGSENPESVAFVRRVVDTDRRSARSSKKKQVAAAVGATVLAGSAMLALQSERSNSNSLRAETGTSDLAANFDISSYQVPDYMNGGRELVISTSQPGLCLDDGGAKKSAFSKFEAVDCRPTSVNQVFVFDDQNLMLKSARKPNLCMSDGGAANPGDGPVRMALCDPNSDDQRFIYENNLFRNPVKDLCLDNGGGTTYSMQTCSPENMDQWFGIMWQTEMGGPVEDFVDDSTTEVAPDSTPEATPSSEKTPTIVNNPYTPQDDMPTDTIASAPTDSTPELPTGGYYNPDTPMMPTDSTSDVPTDTTTSDVATDNTPDVPADVSGLTTGDSAPSGFLEPTTEEPRTLNPADFTPVFTDFNLTEVDGDWNLLAPSHDTIASVNADSSDSVTADEIYTYLLGIKSKAERDYERTLSKYRRTYTCVTAGLQSLAATSVTVEQYHALVSWMYQHCVFDAAAPQGASAMGSGSSDEDETESGEGSGESSVGSEANDEQVERVYMTKLEFYQEIKDHFATERAELVGQAEGVNLRGGMAVATRKKLLACIEAATARFGRYKEYELPENFHNAILWVNDECMNSAP